MWICSFKEQCGLPTVAKLKQCIQSLATRLQSPEGTMGATMVLKEGYPCLEPLVSLSEPTRKLLTAYDTVSETNIHDAQRDLQPRLAHPFLSITQSAPIMFLKFWDLALISCKMKFLYSSHLQVCFRDWNAFSPEMNTMTNQAATFNKQKKSTWPELS